MAAPPAAAEREVIPQRWRWTGPCLLTVAGLLCGAQALCSWPTTGHTGEVAVLLAISLVLDVYDGLMARAGNACTRFGRELDWHTDVALAHAAAWVCFGWWLSVVLVLYQAWCRSGGVRRSGRAWVFGAAAVWSLVRDLSLH